MQRLCVQVRREPWGRGPMKATICGRALVWAGRGVMQTRSTGGRKSPSPPAGLLTVSAGISRSWGDAQVKGFRLGSCKSPAHHPEAPEAWLVGDSWYLGQLDGAVHG